MTIKELIKQLLELPVPVDTSTVSISNGFLAITNISSDENSGVYLIQPELVFVE